MNSIVQLLHYLLTEHHRITSGIVVYSEPPTLANPEYTCKLCTGIDMVEFVLIIFSGHPPPRTKHTEEVLSPAAKTAEHNPDTPQ